MKPHLKAASAPDLAAPHAIRVKDLLATLGVQPAAGLNSADAQARLSSIGRNILRTQPPANVLIVLLKQFNSPVVYLLLAAAVFTLGLAQYTESIAIMAVLAINAVIGFATELRAVRSMEALRVLATHSVLIRRDGAAAMLPAEQLVPGDIVIVEAGDVVAADMRIIQSANLGSDESALTGESLPVAKSIEPVRADASLVERPCMLFKGCAITRGTGEAVVTATGMNTELGSITQLVAQSVPERSPLEKQLSRLSRHLIWLTLVLAALIGVAGIAAGQNIVLMIESSVALAVAAIPEGLPIVATLALARGMLRMARHNALIEQLSAVQTLGATTVIMTDKTGTLTENRMHVGRLVTAAGELTFERHQRAFLLDGRPVNAASDPVLNHLLRNAALCCNASLKSNGGESTGDPMEIALLEAAAAAGLQRPGLLGKYPEITEHAFDVETLMMSTVHRDDGGYVVAVKGAPEAVFEHVRDVATASGTAAFDRRQARRWTQVCDALARQGLRLLAIAGKHVQQPDVPPYEQLTLFGLIGFEDPPRPDISSSIADARRAGIKVVMVTGDHAATALHIADAIGLAPAAAAVFRGDELKPIAEMSAADRNAMLNARVFSRVAPDQKLDLITLHQQAGEVVAMTGDGVNDAPALKKADIGIAMGLRGTQVAREAADMVLRDDAFSTIVHAIREGRVIHTNIRRFTTYLLSCNLSEILAVGLAVLAGLPLPLLPLQILFLNLVTDVFPALALGTIEADRDVLSRPPRPPSEPILARPQWLAIIAHGGVITAVALSAMLAAIHALGLAGDAATTMSFFTLALAQLWHVFNMRNWRDRLIFNQLTRNTYVWLAIALCILILSVAALQPDIAAALHLVSLPPAAWAVVLALSLVPVVVREAVAAGIRIGRKGR
jgi:Ca2+-transporting ATPase